MEDDIDDLLNDVESKFCVRSNHATDKKKGKTSQPISSKPRKATKDQDLDSMIDDIFDEKDMVHSTTAKVSLSKSQELKPTLNRKGSTGPSGRKCFPVFMGSPQCAQGLSSTVNNRACDNLRCTDCDFAVCVFANYGWHSSVDYLFLRNNIPDFDRLKSKLVSRKGSCAYACQCKSRSIKEITNLQDDMELKWVCGKH